MYLAHYQQKQAASPTCAIGQIVVDQVTAGTITSSPGLESIIILFLSLNLSLLIIAEKANKFVDEPELTLIACLTLRYLANFFSNFFFTHSHVTRIKSLDKCFLLHVPLYFYLVE